MKRRYRVSVVVESDHGAWDLDYIRDTFATVRIEANPRELEHKATPRAKDNV